MTVNYGNSPLKVLIVDDVAKNIQVIGNILQNENYDIYFANSGITALEQALENELDLILLDVMMPEMDGFQVCEELKKNEATKEIPVIFITAKTDSESIVKGFSVGGVDYITKPFNSTELVARVKTHLELRAANKRLKNAVKQLNEEIEERLQVERTLLESEKKLKELNATKDKFFSIVSHDLKNPFNTLMGFSELLINHYELLTETKIKNFHQLIYNTAKHGFNLLENLLEWSRSQTGTIKWKPEKIDLYKAINGTTGMLISAAENKKISLISAAEKETYVFADFNMISTVVRNLVSNAIKFTPENGMIRVEVEKKENQVIVSVIDNGVGISKSDSEKLFRLDVNHSTKGTSDEKGTGLGLLLCKEFVEKNGGTLTIESKVNHGSKFSFTLELYTNQIFDN